MRRKTIALFFFLCTTLFPLMAGTKNVLLLNSYHRGLMWSDDIFNGVKQVIDQHNNVNLFTEYMDAKRNDDPAYYEELFSLYSLKYKDIPFDLVICADNNALDFAIKHKDSPLFKGFKVYCGVNNTDDYQYLGEDYRGVSEREFFIERFHIIKKIVPQAKTIYCLLDKTDFGAIFRNRLEQVIQHPPIKVNIKIIDTIDLNDLFRFVSSLKDSAVIDYISITRDRYGNIVNNEKTARKIARISSVPVFSNADYLISQGVVAGVYQLGVDQGKLAATIGMKLIEGQPPKSIPAVSEAPMRIVVDYGVLKRFNLQPHNLPKDAMIINQPEKIYTKYKSEFIIALVGFIILLSIILQLLISIQKQRLSELSLQQSEQKFKDIAELLPQTIYECDLIGNLSFVNKQALEMFGYSQEDFNKGVNLKQLFVPEEWGHIQQNIKDLAEGKSVKDNLYVAKRKNGSVFPFEVHSNVFYKDGKSAGFRGIGIDMTAQKKVEQELIIAREKAEQSDKLKSAFLSNMSHEIRTPLNAIIGFSNLLSDEDTSNEQRLEYKKYIQNSSEYLLNLINDIIDHSRIEAGQLEIVSSEFNLNDLMKELYLNFKSQQKNKFKEHIELKYENLNQTEEIIVEADPVRIKQVIANLLDNAFKFTDNGSIQFGYVLQKGDNILITVKDTGIGINEEDKPLVFKRFYKLCNEKDKLYGGSGLGLSICKNLVSLMKGSIWFESKKGAGTQFYINLPVCIKKYKQIVVKSSTEDDLSNFNWNGKTILVAEDEISNFELVKAFLRHTNATIIHAANGKEAVNFIQTNQIDLILMDIQMPVMSGYEAIRMIRQIQPKIPIIAQTAYAMAGEKEEILQSGSDAYLAKPLDRSTLLETIHSLINK